MNTPSKAFSFSEKRIRGLPAPTPPPGKSYVQVYYKDTTVPGLQVCVTSAGEQVLLHGQADRRQADAGTVGHR